MGITCSICDEVKCVKCGVPRAYYKNSKHASRKSCRVDKNGIWDKTMGYHEWG